MSKLFYKAVIEDVENRECTGAEQEALLDTFAYTMRRMATTLARRAWYEMKDYATSRQCGIEHFTLAVERKEVCGQEQWWGVFEHGSKNLDVIGTLEK